MARSRGRFHLTTLVFDFGLRHIGVAVAEPSRRFARGVDTVPARDGGPQWRRLDDLTATWQPDRLVVGLPVNMDGTASAMSARARCFGSRLAERYALPVEYVDERLSTFEATSRGADAADSHAAAAQVIAETWLAQP